MEQNQIEQSTPKVSLTTATFIVSGSMIGSGIFIVSADMSRVLGSPFLLMLAWALTGVMTLIAALSYGELAGMFPKSGGQYQYLKESMRLEEHIEQKKVILLDICLKSSWSMQKCDILTIFQKYWHKLKGSSNTH